MKAMFKSHSRILFSLVILLFLFSNSAEIFGAADSLKYIVHSFVKLKSKEGKVIYIDPFSVANLTDSADVVLITHEHSDHNDLTKVRVRKTGTIIRAATALVGGVYKSFTFGNITVKAVPAYNGNHPKSTSVGYVVDLNGIKIYHPGDTGKITEMADLAAEKISYALFPMDGTYTMTPEAATEAASLIKAKVDIPIHTTAATLTFNDAMAARFTSPNKLVMKFGTTIELKAGLTSIKDSKELPGTFELNQNYPNPFNPETTISYRLSTASRVTLKVYNALGKEVATLVDEIKQPGSYNSIFSSNRAGSIMNSQLSSGVYFYSLRAGNNISTKKMLLIK